MKSELIAQSSPNSNIANSISNWFKMIWPRYGGLFMVLCIGTLIETLYYFGFKIPNPPALLILVVVYITFIGGYWPGFVSAGLSWLYIAVFFSLPDQPFQYTDENLVRVVVWGITLPLTVWMVGLLEFRSRKKHSEEQQYNLGCIIEASINEIYLFNLQSLRFEFVNSGARNNLGYTQKQLTKMTPLDIKPEFTEESFRKMLGPMLRHEQPRHEFQTVHQRADGSLYPVEVHLQLVEQAGHSVFLAVILDITRRLEVEKKLEETERKISLILNSAGEGIYGLDSSGNITFINPVGQRMIGWKFDELVGKPLHETIHHTRTDGNAYPREECPIYAAFTDGKVHHVYDEVLWRKDGTSFPVEYTSTPVRKDGNPIGAVVVFRDITERRQTMHILHEKEERLRLAMDAAHMGIFDWKIPDNHITWSQWHEEMWGYKPGEFENTYESFSERVHPDDLPGVNAEVARCIADREPFEYEFRVVWPDDSVHWIHARGEFTFDNEGQPVRMLGTVVEITDRKLAEVKIRESEQRLRTILDSSPVPMALNDELQNITFLNAAFIKNFGYTLDDLPTLEQWWPKAYPDPEYCNWVRETWQSTLEKAKLNNTEFPPMELKIRSKDGNIKTVLGSAASLGESYENVHLVILYDISERKQSEENLYRVNRALAVLSECNRAMLHAKDEQHLLNDICRIIVETGNYRMSWVGYVEHDENKSVQPVAHWGYEQGYIDSLNLTWADTERGRGPVGTCIRTGKASLARDLQTNPDFAPWRQAALERGYASVLGIPLYKEKDVFGALTIYAAGPEAFNTEETDLLENLAGNLAFGINTLRTEKEQIQMENLLRQREGHLRFLYEENPTMYFTVKSDGTILSVNEFGANELGYNVKELQGKSILSVFPEANHEKVQEHLQFCLRNFGQLHEWEIQKIDKNGKKLWVKETARAVGTPDGQTAVLIVCHDITRRKQVEEALRKSEIRFRTIFENAPVMIDSFDKNGRCSMWNKECEKTFGWTIEEINSHDDPLSLFYPDPKIRNQVIDSVISNPKNIFREWCPQTKDGRVLTCMWANFSLPDGSVINLGYDITARKQVEKALVESEKKYRDVVETATEIIFTTDLHGKFTYANPAALRACGYTLKELRHLSALDLILPGHRHAILKTYSTCFKAEDSTGYIEFPFRTKSGAVLWFGQNASLIHEGNHKTGWHLIARDITERKQFEIALQESEMRARSIADFSPIGIFMSAPDGHIIYENAAIRQLLGIVDEEVLGDRWVEAVHPEDLDRVFTVWTQFITGERPDYDVEFRFVRQDGTERMVHARATHIYDEKHLIGFVGTAEDITMRKQTELAIKETNLQLRTLAHQLQNIREEERTSIAREIHDVLAQVLTRLKLDTSRMQRQLASKMDTSTRKSLSLKVQELSDHTDIAIKTVQKIATELRPVVLDEFGLSAAIEWQVENFEQHTGIACHVSVPVQELPINIDQATAVFRILQESLTNVIRHSGATLLNVSLLQVDEELILQVQDNGCGIKQGALYNLHSIGLMGMRERALAMGGNLQITGNHAAGTTVTLHIPLVVPALHAK